MTDLNRTAPRWVALAAIAALPLAWPAASIAQAPAPAPAPMSAAERAQRDAERVFEFIKFHTLRPKTIEPPRPARPAAPATAPAPAPAVSPERASTPARPVAADVPAKPAASVSESASPPPPAPATTAAPVSTPVVPPAPAPVAAPPAAPEPVALPAVPQTAAPAAMPANDTDDADDAELQLQSFVAPVLSPAVQATLGAGARNVKVRFTVEVDGRVSAAEAAATVPKRLAKPAVDAILQWRFAPLAQPRTVEVEIAFRRD